MKKRPRKTEQEILILTHGTEPDWSDLSKIEDVQLQLVHSLNYYNAVSSSKQLRQWAADWAKKQGYSKDDVETIKKADLRQFSNSGRYARLDLLGAPIDQKMKDTITRDISVVLRSKQLKEIEEAREEMRKASAAPKPSVQDRISEQVSDLLSQIEPILDEALVAVRTYGKKVPEFNLQEFLKNNDVKSIQSKKIVDHYQDVLAELKAAIGGDEELREGYSHLKDSQLKNYAAFVEQMLGEAKAWQETATKIRKANRKPRKKKQKNPLDLVKAAKWCQDDKEFGLKSLHPSKIIGKSKVLLFNVKYRKLTLLVAEDEVGGFGFKGTTIQGINEEKSICKMVRKPKNVLKDVKDAGIRKVNATFKELTTKPSKVTGRIGEDTVILSVF